MITVLFTTNKEFTNKTTNEKTLYTELTLVDDVEKKTARAKVYGDDVTKTPFKVGEEVDLIGYIKFDGSLGVKVAHKKGDK